MSDRHEGPTLGVYMELKTGEATRRVSIQYTRMNAIGSGNFSEALQCGVVTARGWRGRRVHQKTIGSLGQSFAVAFICECGASHNCWVTPSTGLDFTRDTYSKLKYTGRGIWPRPNIM